MRRIPTLRLPLASARFLLATMLFVMSTALIACGESQLPPSPTAPKSSREADNRIRELEERIQRLETFHPLPTPTPDPFLIVTDVRLQVHNNPLDELDISLASSTTPASVTLYLDIQAHASEPTPITFHLIADGIGLIDGQQLVLSELKTVLETGVVNAVAIDGTLMELGQWELTVRTTPDFADMFAVEPQRVSVSTDPFVTGADALFTVEDTEDGGHVTVTFVAKAIGTRPAQYPFHILAWDFAANTRLTIGEKVVTLLPGDEQTIQLSGDLSPGSWNLTVTSDTKDYNGTFSNMGTVKDIIIN